MDFLNKYPLLFFNRFKTLKNRISLPFGLSTWTTALSLFFLVNILIQNANQLEEIKVSIYSYILFIFSFLICLISIYSNAFAWKLLLIWLGYAKIDLINIIPLYLRTNLLKYLPGGIWHFVARLRALDSIKNQPKKSIKSVILEPLLMISASILLVPLGGFNAGLTLLCFLPSLLFFTKWKDPIIKKIKSYKYKEIYDLEKEELEERIISENQIGEIGYPFKALIIEVIFIILRFSSFYLCLLAFGSQIDFNIFKLISAFALAWTLGLIIPAAPGGIGVFEAALTLQIGKEYPQAILVSVLLIYRLITSSSDFLAAILNSFKPHK